MSDHHELTVEQKKKAVSLIRALYQLDSDVIPSGDLVHRARQLDPLYQRAPTGSPTRTALAGVLLDITDCLQKRIAKAPIDLATLLPRVDGLRWDVSSPLAGNLTEIAPFEGMEMWAADAPSRQRNRSGYLRKRIKKYQFDGDLVVGRRSQQKSRLGRHGSNERWRINHLSRQLSVPSDISLTVTEWLDIVSFHLEFGTFAAESIWGIILPFGVAIATTGFSMFLEIWGFVESLQDGDNIARFNARLRGFSEALEALANEFGTIDIMKDPSEWPSLHAPELPTPKDMTHPDAPAQYQLGINDANRWLTSIDRESGLRPGVLFLYWLHGSEWRDAHRIRQEILRRANYEGWQNGYLSRPLRRGEGRN